jgi:PAS domain S-box-containing protein
MSKPKPAARLLVVDDDRGVRQLAAKALGREGYGVAAADSGAAALQWLEHHQADLLLLDLKLPDLEARDLVARLGRLKRLPPFLIITGQGDERVAVEMMKSGARDYLVKDADFLEFLPAAVARVLKQIEQERKLAAAEEALRMSEERFRVALKTSPIMVFNQDCQLHYTWIHNPPAGQTARTMLAKTDGQIFSAEDADRLAQIKMRVLLTGEGLRQEVSWTLKGRKRFYDLTVEVVRDSVGNTVGITGAAMEITGRKRLEEEVLQISDREQRRIGQDLHDGICQHLAGIELKSQALAQNLEKQGEGRAAPAEEIARHVRDVIVETRSLARGLCPFILESEGLMSALTELAANTQKLFGIRCQFVSDAPPASLSAAIAMHLYRIAQEAVTNAIKHGKAAAIEIQLSGQGDNLVLTISDNGTGFGASPENAPGMGLRIMQYRAGIIGATLLTQEQSGGGARIVCFLPKN